MLGLRVATVDALGSERNIVPFVSYLELKADTSFIVRIPSYKLDSTHSFI